jgi:hypothetical protein
MRALRVRGRRYRGSDTNAENDQYQNCERDHFRFRNDVMLLPPLDWPKYP